MCYTQQSKKGRTLSINHVLMGLVGLSFTAQAAAGNYIERQVDIVMENDAGAYLSLAEEGAVASAPLPEPLQWIETLVVEEVGGNYGEYITLFTLHDFPHTEANHAHYQPNGELVFDIYLKDGSGDRTNEATLVVTWAFPNNSTVPACTSEIQNDAESFYSISDLESCAFAIDSFKYFPIVIQSELYAGADTLQYQTHTTQSPFDELIDPNNEPYGNDNPMMDIPGGMLDNTIRLAYVEEHANAGTGSITYTLDDGSSTGNETTVTFRWEGERNQDNELVGLICDTDLSDVEDGFAYRYQVTGSNEFACAFTIGYSDDRDASLPITLSNNLDVGFIQDITLITEHADSSLLPYAGNNAAIFTAEDGLPTSPIAAGGGQGDATVAYFSADVLTNGRMSYALTESVGRAAIDAYVTFGWAQSEVTPVCAEAVWGGPQSFLFKEDETVPAPIECQFAITHADAAQLTISIANDMNILDDSNDELLSLVGMPTPGGPWTDVTDALPVVPVNQASLPIVAYYPGDTDFDNEDGGSLTYQMGNDPSNTITFRWAFESDQNRQTLICLEPELSNPDDYSYARIDDGSVDCAFSVRPFIPITQIDTEIGNHWEGALWNLLSQQESNALIELERIVHDDRGQFSGFASDIPFGAKNIDNPIVFEISEGVSLDGVIRYRIDNDAIRQAVGPAPEDIIRHPRYLEVSLNNRDEDPDAFCLVRVFEDIGAGSDNPESAKYLSERTLRDDDEDPLKLLCDVSLSTQSLQQRAVLNITMTNYDVLDISYPFTYKADGLSEFSEAPEYIYHSSDPSATVTVDNYDANDVAIAGVSGNMIYESHMFGIQYGFTWNTQASAGSRCVAIPDDDLPTKNPLRVTGESYSGGVLTCDLLVDFQSVR